MALLRAPSDYQDGTLSTAAAISDTTLASPAFAALPSTYSATNVCPLIVHNPTLGTHEVVWVTAHAANSTTVTVLRGKEGTAAQAWPSNTQWICAPTATRDGLAVMTAAQLAGTTDQHVGMRAVESDTGLLKIATSLAGWQPDAGVCLPSEVGKTAANGTVPSGATILLRMGCYVSIAMSSQNLPVTFSTPFPNGIIGAVAGSLATGQFIGTVTCNNCTVTGFNANCYQFNSVAPGLASIFYLAFGW